MSGKQMYFLPQLCLLRPIPRNSHQKLQQLLQQQRQTGLQQQQQQQ